MTEIQLKKLLRQLHAARVEESLLEECLKTPESGSENLLRKENAPLRIIGETLNLLNRNERLIHRNPSDPSSYMSGNYGAVGK